MTTKEAQEQSNLFGLQDVKHPYSDYRLSDALRLAQNLAQLHAVGRIELKSAEQARQVIKDSLASAGHLWITGMTALDVLDAAIDGKDLLKKTRLI
jgi:hypothetical protein